VSTIFVALAVLALVAGAAATAIFLILALDLMGEGSDHGRHH
jgi:hypothetical protein